MNLFSSIMMVGVIAFLIFISLVLFVYLSYVMEFMGKAAGFLAYPFKKLWELAKQWVQENTDPELQQTLNDRFSVFGGAAGFFAFIVVALLALWAAIWITQETSDKIALLLLLLENTVMGGFIFGAANGTLADVSASTVLAIGFSAGFSLFCMNPVSKGKWYIKFCMYIFSFITMIALAIALDSIFQVVGSWGYQTMTDLLQHSDGGFFLKAGRILALIALGYVALFLILSTAEQYLSFLVFVPISFAFYGLVQWILSLLLQTIGVPANVTDVVLLGLTFALIFGVDLLRNRYEWLRDKIKPLTDKVFLRLFGKSAKKQTELP